jgi:hypothetical protein
VAGLKDDTSQIAAGLLKSMSERVQCIFLQAHNKEAYLTVQYIMGGAGQ